MIVELAEVGIQVSIDDRLDVVSCSINPLQLGDVITIIMIPRPV
jgi:hypothetical protein